MFDPFKDFSTYGYLHNLYGEKELRIVKNIEHALFLRKLPKAKKYLSKRKSIVYEDFLEVHRIIFSEFYPWAGSDRAITTPNLNVSKGDVHFCTTSEIRLAIKEGLRIAENKHKFSENIGKIMGLFAYAHPFLDGNGRTILVIHDCLAVRAGISIKWSAINIDDYLNALTHEINHPKDCRLDHYLLKFIESS